jgi:DNA-binding CsgD family transcriptional regulator
MMSTLDDILYNAVDGAFAVDAKQRIIFWNPGCEELFERSSQSILGRPCNDVMRGRNPLTGTALLVPSCCNKRWVVIHLLHRSVNQDLLTAMDNMSRSGKHSSSINKKRIGDGEKNISRLTARETEVLQLLSEGLSSSVISKRFTVSHTTVRNHIQHIQSKLGVHSQTEAVAYAYRHSLVM